MLERKERIPAANSGCSQQTIAFIELTGGKKFNIKNVSQRPLKEVLDQIKLDTGRQIIIKEESALACIGIVKYDAPLGYALFANKNIKKNQILFNYGGIEGNTKGLTTQYLLEVGAGQCLDAEHQGDLGSLCMHLFDPIQLQGMTPVKIDETQCKDIQFHNLRHEVIQTNYGVDKRFHAREDIPRGAILGFSYGYTYWFRQKVSPLLMSKNGNPIINLSVKEPLFCLRSENQLETGSIVYSKENLLYNFNRFRNNKLCVFWPPEISQPVVYANNFIIQALLEKKSYSSVFVYIDVKDISLELKKALERGTNMIELPLSIYAEHGQVGPFADCYLTDDEMSEINAIAPHYLPS
ncbi:hypothetical protein [Legionella donaldsonii]|uniref:hypothetical protein n=1 Tax=Legionella donaldsonii TaxID=45060 RepID=UPI00399CD44B